MLAMEPVRAELTAMYLADTPINEIVGKYANHLDDIGVPTNRHKKFLYAVFHVWEVKRISTPSNTQEETELITQLSLQLEKERQSRKIAESKYKELSKTHALETRIVEMMQTAVVAADPIQTPEPLKVNTNSEQSHALVALLSDLHVGEVVDSAQISGLDEYNLETFSRRMQRWTENLILLTDLKRTRLDVPHLEIFGLGDFVSGEIHDELIRTNEVHVLEQVYYAVKEIAKSFMQLAAHFEKISFTGVAGNHGRNARKPYAKNKQTLSFDYLIYQMMTLVLQNQTNIEFIIPKSFFAYRDVLGTRFVLMHGDGIRSSLGLPYYGIARARARFQDILGVDTRFDYLVIGHYHHGASVDDLYFINPSFKGADEYSVAGMFGANRPTQTLLTIHPEHGVVSSERIFLDNVEVTTPDFTPPPTWGDTLTPTNRLIPTP